MAKTSAGEVMPSNQTVRPRAPLSCARHSRSQISDPFAPCAWPQVQHRSSEAFGADISAKRARLGRRVGLLTFLTGESNGSAVSPYGWTS
jgi:hypothetical protein